jgi:hypothetical protein
MQLPSSEINYLKTDWSVSWPSPAQSFLVRDPTGITIIFLSHESGSPAIRLRRRISSYSQETHYISVTKINRVKPLKEKSDLYGMNYTKQKTHSVCRPQIDCVILNNIYRII